MRRLAASSLILSGLLLPSLVTGAHGARPKPLPRLVQFPNASGIEATYAAATPVDPAHPFFQSLGSNGRSCGTCHDPATGWSITPALAQAAFAATGGDHPLFRLVDGANAPTADTGSPEARLAAYSMLLNRGVIRIEREVPAGAEFEVSAVDDPYSYATPQRLSLYRRPLPSTNLKFHSTIMWDGRETRATLVESLRSQAQGAQTGHAEGALLPETSLQSIVDFELGLFTAQVRSSVAGPIDRAGGRGGPNILRRQAYYPGINDPFQLDPKRKKFNPNVFQLFKPWAKLSVTHRNPVSRAKGSIGRGEKLFNTFQFNIFRVNGLNDLRGETVIRGTCSTCHNVPGVGTFSLNQTMNIGTELLFARQPDQPLYTLRNLSTQEEVLTSDPGRAMITGKWSDVGQFKTPSLRNLASRAPYFHDGSAQTLEEVVDFYIRRFGISMRGQDILDIAAFLRSL